MYEYNHLAQAISQASDGRHDATFLIDGQTGHPTSYGTFWANAERMAAALVRLGLKPGDRVAVQAPKEPAMLELYVGTVLAGGVFLPLNTAYTPSEISYFLDDASPHVFVCDPDRRDALAGVISRADIAHVLTLGASGAGSLATARDAQSAGFKAVARGPLDLAAILYTSGTTGRSKGAMLTHRALASNSATLREYWRFTDQDVLIHALPIYHTHGLFVATNVTLMAGASAIFMAGFDAEAIIDAMPRATALMGVPTFYTRLLKDDRLSAASRDMRLFVSGSAPLLAETHTQWREVTGHGILERYGMTETNMNTSNPYDGERRAGTVGFPLPGVEVKVCDQESGNEVPIGEIGVLEVRGDNVFAGYWQMPEKTAEELRDDGWFITGDLAMIDGDGYVRIVGRGKDLIISGGFNVYPKEVETVIDALPDVLESAVIGVPHEDFGEAVVAVVVAHPDRSIDEAQVLMGSADQLARFKQPKRVVVVDELPRNTMGKVQKNVMRDSYADLLKD
ncbi:malonate--CoA ligase [Aliiroseovarius sp. 2305UL8-7]|uniref:malonate--CoA ligase n=1 Tax=Aliiroseovarius conchicola TaxID=3121637 RepID=UPI0035283F6D